MGQALQAKRSLRDSCGQCDNDGQVQKHGDEEEDGNANDAALVAHVCARTVGDGRTFGGDEPQRDTQAQGSAYG